MTAPVGALQPELAANPSRVGAGDARIEQAAREFEAILVRQLLSATKLAGKQNAYEDMAADALATAVTAGNGLGLARQIQDAVARAAVHGAAPGATGATKK